MRLDGTWSVADTEAVAARVGRHGRATGPFDIAVPGESDPGDAGRTSAFAAHESAGATWWVEAVHPWRYGWQEGKPWPLEPMRQRIGAGP